MLKKECAKKILAGLKRAYPDTKTALHFDSALQSLIATILSAQCTDTQVNKVTPALFKRFVNADAFARADLKIIESMIRSTGFYKNKARSIKNCCIQLVKEHNGNVPKEMDKLIKLPGVGRKTANAVRGNFYGLPGIVADTHVIRISQRLGLTKSKDPVKIEFALHPLFPEKDWTRLSLLIQEHGRKCCTARKPRCQQCPIAKYCQYYKWVSA